MPSPTPIASVPLRISAQLDPTAPTVGSEFVLRLFIADDGSRAAHGVYIATTGPWDRWTVLRVDPAGSVSRDSNGWRIVSPLEVPPGGSAQLEVHVRADSPSEVQLTFAVREAEPGELP